MEKLAWKKPDNAVPCFRCHGGYGSRSYTLTQELIVELHAEFTAKAVISACTNSWTNPYFSFCTYCLIWNGWRFDSRSPAVVLGCVEKAFGGTTLAVLNELLKQMFGLFPIAYTISAIAACVRWLCLY